MWPAWMPQDMDNPDMKTTLSKLGHIRVGAVIFCNGAREDSRLTERATDILKLTTNPVPR
jgi:hypothetical protein